MVMSEAAAEDELRISDVALYFERKFPRARADQLARALGELYQSTSSPFVPPENDVIGPC